MKKKKKQKKNMEENQIKFAMPPQADMQYSYYQ